MIAANKRTKSFSPVVSEVFPKFRPRLTQVAEDENVGIADGRAILDAIAICQTARLFAGGKTQLQEIEGFTQHDQSLRRRISIAAQLVGIHSSDGPWQTISRTIKVDDAGLIVITGQNPQSGLPLLRE